MASLYRRSRRVWLGIVPAAALVVGACGGPATESSEADPASADLTFADFGGNVSKAIGTAWLKAYSDETGAKFTQDPGMDYNKIKVQVQSGNVQWDLAEVDAWFAEQQCGVLFEELDPGTLDPSKFGDGYVTNKCGVPAVAWGTVLTYDKSKFQDDPPTTWADFFDTKKYPGKRCSTNLAQFNLEAALLADGVAPEDLYPLDVARAIAKWKTIRKDTTFLTSSTQYVDTMLSGGAVMCAGFSARVFDAVDQGADWGVSWPTLLKNWDNIVVLKGSPNAADAKAFLSWLADHPEAQTKLEEIAPFGSTAPESDPQASDLQKEFLMSNHEKEGIQLDFGWYAKNMDAAQSEWQASLIG